MARVINGTLTATRSTLNDGERRRAQARLDRRAARNPLRRVLLACDERSTRDAVAVVGDHVWCATHEDFGRVVSVVE